MSLGWSALRLMVVDDNRYVRGIAVTLAQAMGVRTVVQAADGGEALALLRTDTVDVALVDMNMAPVDGVTFTREVRQSPDTPDPYLPIIMMTGEVERSRVERARDAGANEFLLKPLTAAALVGRMEAVLLRPRPFVRARGYFGPDRRRRDDPSFLGPWRRAEDRGEPAPSSVLEL